MCPPPPHHHPCFAAVHQPYNPSDPAAVHPQSSATLYTPYQSANPNTRFHPPPYATFTASPAAATGISGYPLSTATPCRSPQTVTPTTQFYPPPYPTATAAATATATSNYPLSTATLYRPPRPVVPTTQFYPTSYPAVSATRISDFPLSTAANSATPYRPPHTVIPTPRFRPIPPYSAAVNHSQSQLANHPIPRPDLAAAPISGEDYQRRLRDEAIFLHGLWHQGPPSSDPNFNSAINNPISDFHLKPAPSTTFKKKKKKKKNAHPRPVSDIPWPVPPDSTTQPESEVAWPAFLSIPAPSIGVDSEEEKARAFAIRVQKGALNSVQNFFARKYGPDSEIDSDEDEDDGLDYHGYLTGIFEGVEDLRRYYENNWRKGEFLCLICGGSGKKFKDCVALVQHTVTILKTKKRVAHRAYGQVICNLLRWNIHNLPSVAEDPSNQQAGDSGKVESGKDDGKGAVENAVLSVNDNEHSDPSKSGSVAGDDVPPISEDPGAQQLNDENHKSETADGNPAAVHKLPDREL